MMMRATRDLLVCEYQVGMNFWNSDFSFICFETLLSTSSFLCFIHSYRFCLAMVLLASFSCY